MSGQTSVVLVTGEPGIGKTTLLNAGAGRATNQGATVLRGGAPEAEGMPPRLGSRARHLGDRIPGQPDRPGWAGYTFGWQRTVPASGPTEMPKTGGEQDVWVSLWLVLVAGAGLVAAGWFLRQKSIHTG